MSDRWQVTAGVLVVAGWLLSSLAGAVHIAGWVAGWWGWHSHALMVVFAGLMLLNAGALGLKRAS